MTEKLVFTYDEVLENAKSFSYDVEEYETTDDGYGITVYQSSFYCIHYYFDKDKNFTESEIEDLTNFF